MGKITEKASFGFIRYANCWEDPALLLEALKGRKTEKILSIASAGDNSFSLLLTGADLVVAVDVSEAQLHLVELKKACFIALTYEEMLAFLGFRSSAERKDRYQDVRKHLPQEAAAYWDLNQEQIAKGIIHQGKFERYFQMFASRLLPFVHSKKTIEGLLENKTQEAQQRYYRERFDTWKWRLLFRIFFSKTVMGKYGRDPAFLAHVKTTVGKHIYGLAARHLQDPACQENYMLRYNLTGDFNPLLPDYLKKENHALIKSRISSIVTFKGYAEDAISGYGKFDAMNLSNIFEYLAEDEFRPVAENLCNGLNPGGTLLYWNLMVPRRISAISSGVNHAVELSARLKQRDRGFFYNDFIVEHKH